MMLLALACSTRQWHEAPWHTSTCQQLVSIGVTSLPCQTARTLKQACFWGCPKTAVRIQVSIDSQSSAIHNAYHSSLRPSSLLKPRHPSLNVVGVCVKRGSHSYAQEARARGVAGKILGDKAWKRAVDALPDRIAHEALPGTAAKLPSPDRAPRRELTTTLQRACE